MERRRLLRASRTAPVDLADLTSAGARTVVVFGAGGARHRVRGWRTSRSSAAPESSTSTAAASADISVAHTLWRMRTTVRLPDDLCAQVRTTAVARVPR